MSSDADAVQQQLSAQASNLRKALESSNWEQDFLQKSTKLTNKVHEAQKQGARLSKGAGGNVSSVIKARWRLQRIIQLMEALLSPCASAIMHGSVALTSLLESQKHPLKQLLQNGNTVEKYNVQNHPWVNMDHNSTVQAYHTLRDHQCQLHVERAMQRDYGPYFNNKKQQREASDEFRTRLRARMRRETLTTLRVSFKNKEDALERYGSTQVVLSAIVYRKLPADVEEQITPAGMTSQRIIDICTQGMIKHEALYASQHGLLIPRAIRTLPSNLTFNYFDQETHFWHEVLPRIKSCVEQGLSGADAVNHVFHIDREDEPNQCQRAFGHWLLVELKSTFGAKFSDMYKRIVRRVLLKNNQDEGVKQVFRDILEKLHHILAEFEKAHANFKQVSNATSSRNDGSGSSTSTTTMGVPKNYNHDDRTPAHELLHKNEQRTRLQVLADDNRKRKLAELDAAETSNDAEQLLSTNKRGYKYARSHNTLKPNASWWMQPWNSSIAQAPASTALVPAALELGEQRSGEPFEALHWACLRRSPMEIEVGAKVEETATNATNPMRAAERRAARSAKSKRGKQAAAAAAVSKPKALEVGVDARRTIAAQQDKPTLMRDYIQHTDAKGRLPVTYTLKKRANFLVNEHEPDEEMLQNVKRVAEHGKRRLSKKAVFDFDRSLEHVQLSFAHEIKQALKQSRTPTRMETETGNAIYSSERMHKAAHTLGVNSVRWFVAMRAIN